MLQPDLETAALPTDVARIRKQCERRRKHGKRGGVRDRLRANPMRPALPTLMLSNVRSLENKLDIIQLSRSTQYEVRDCCMFVFTETWFNENIPDSAIQLQGHNAAVVTKHCSSLVEVILVKCRPFYLPREFTAIVIVALYIPPCVNAKMLRTHCASCTANNKQITLMTFSS